MKPHKEQFNIFIDSNGVINKRENMQDVLNKVANDWEKLGYDMDTANEIRNGIINSFTIWQRVDVELTGINKQL